MLKLLHGRNIFACKCVSQKFWFRLPQRKMTSNSSNSGEGLYVNKRGEVPNIRYIKTLKKVNDLSRAGTGGAPHIIDACVVSPGSNGSPRSVNVNFGHYFRYQFNCGESTQRICGEKHRLGLKLQDIFITRTSWQNLGGLMGMCFNLNASLLPGVRLHGPPNIEKLVTESKNFSQYKSQPINVVKHEVIDGGCYEDAFAHVYYIPMVPEDTPQSEPVAKKQKLSTDDLCVGYLCQPKPRARTINIEKCYAAGIKQGILVGKLKNGETITLEDGKVVTPEEVLDPAASTQPFLVLECATIGHLERLLDHPKISELHEGENTPSVIYHLTEHDVLTHPLYRQWVNKLPESTQHVVLNSNCSGMVLQKLYQLQARLGMIDPLIFPQLSYPHTQGGELPDNMVYGKTYMTYAIRAKNKDTPRLSTEECISVKTEEFREELVAQEPSIADVLEQYRQKHGVREVKGDASYPEVVFLGTGSAVPASYRNQSGILLNISAEKCMLLDCGEDTIGQLERFYGDRTADMMVKLQAVFISHLHADHHLGLYGVVLYRKRVLESRGLPVTPLPVICPGVMNNWYTLSSRVLSEIDGSLRLLDSRRFLREQLMVTVVSLIDQLEMRDLETVPVRHPGFASGLVLVHKSGWKLVYSGDTVPCTGLIQIGRNCDLLIHEATLDDGSEEEAYKKRHSTISQAVKVGKDMNAKFTLLTHFSQRFSKSPLMNHTHDSLGFAFDNMRVSLDELPILPGMHPVFCEMFAEDIVEMSRRKMNKRHKDTQKKKEKTNVQNKVQTEASGSGLDSAKNTQKEPGKKGQNESVNGQSEFVKERKTLEKESEEEVQSGADKNVEKQQNIV